MTLVGARSELKESPPDQTEEEARRGDSSPDLEVERPEDGLPLGHGKRLVADQAKLFLHVREGEVHDGGAGQRDRDGSNGQIRILKARRTIN